MQKSYPDPNRQSKIIEDFRALGFAAERGNIETLKTLIELSPDLAHSIIKYDNYYVFRIASENGHIEVLKYLVELTPGLEQKDDMVHSVDNYSFKMALSNYHLRVLQYLVELTPKQHQRDRMIRGTCDGLFNQAVEDNDIAIRYFSQLECYGEIQREMLVGTTFNNTGFKKAMENGNTATSLYLMSLITDSERKGIFNSYPNFDQMPSNSKFNLLQCLSLIYSPRKNKPSLGSIYEKKDVLVYFTALTLFTTEELEKEKSSKNKIEALTTIQKFKSHFNNRAEVFVVLFSILPLVLKLFTCCKARDHSIFFTSDITKCILWHTIPSINEETDKISKDLLHSLSFFYRDAKLPLFNNQLPSNHIDIVTSLLDGLNKCIDEKKNCSYKL